MIKVNWAINRKGLQWQLLSRFFLILMALFLIFGVSQYISMRQYLYDNINETLQSRFHSLDLESLGQINTKNALMDKSRKLIISLFERNSSVSLIDAGGNIVDSSVAAENEFRYKNKNMGSNILRHSIPVPKLSKEDYLKILLTDGNLEHMYRLVKDENNMPQIVAWRKIGDIKSPSGLIQLGSPAGEVQSILLRQIYVYLGGLALILIIGTLLGEAVFRKTLNPLYNMTKTVENITVGELHTRLPEDNGSLEIDKLSESFNKMLTGIEASFQNEQKTKDKMRQFISDASHELRTPLTSIHGFVEVLLRGAAKNEVQLDSALKSILSESERLTKLVHDLLMITKLDQKPPVVMSIENINTVIDEIYMQLQILAGERHIRLNLSGAPMVKINKDQIKQVLFNLTQNAVQHTDKKSGIIVISTNIEQIDKEDFVSIKVSDNGTGISREHISKIFDRFFRSEFHRSREQGGYGLGLSIVKSIVEAHDGKITVDSTPGSGTIFTVYLSMQKV